jgi:hypothetical protein
MPVLTTTQPRQGRTACLLQPQRRSAASYERLYAADEHGGNMLRPPELTTLSAS